MARCCLFVTSSTAEQIGRKPKVHLSVDFVYHTSKRSSDRTTCDTSSPLTQVAVDPRIATAEALSRLMAKEFLRRKGGGEFFCEGDR